MTNEEWAEIAKAIGGLIVVVWAAIKARSWAIVRTAHDRVTVEASLQEVDLLRRQAARIKELEEQIGILAQERNDAIASVGRLSAQIESLRERVAELKAELDMVRATLDQALKRGG
jgi:phage shock protein A